MLSQVFHPAERILAGTAGLLLFGFSVFHGINKSDALYLPELGLAWSLAAGGFYCGLCAFKRGRRKQRALAALALALIVSTMALVTLLNRTPDPLAPPPPSVVEGE